jgi:hypothetical protein
MLGKTNRFGGKHGGDLQVALEVILRLSEVHRVVAVHVNGETPGKEGPILRKD